MVTILFEEGSAEPKGAQMIHQKKRLLNNVVDGMAAIRPQALWAELPISPVS